MKFWKNKCAIAAGPFMARKVQASFLLPALGAAVLFLGGCSSGGSEAAREDESPKASAAPSGDGQVQFQSAPASPRLIRNTKALVKCFEDKGWTATVDKRTAIAGFGGPVEQVSLQKQAWDDCERDLTKAGVLIPDPKLSDAELSDLYDKVSEQTKCFVKHGYEPSRKMPSRRVFIDSEGAWTPHALIRYIDGEELAQLDRDCPEPRQ